jgi:DNA-directed RNA polymerase I subunit RPA1
MNRVLSVWIELQSTVNCFIDSSKDTGPNAKDAPPGLRQILEKKEGLFRKHMVCTLKKLMCFSHSFM